MIGFIGATEQLLFIQIGTLYCFFIKQSNALYAGKYIVPGTEYEMTYADTVVVFAFLTGIHYNLENILTSFFAAEDKKYALCCMVPYAQFFVMLFASSYSSYFETYPAYFLILCGMHLTYVTAIFNVSSTSNSKFEWVFTQPFEFLAMVFLEANQIVT